MAEQASRDGVIELVEERAVIGKRLVDSGGVRVSTRTEVQTEMVNAALQEFAVEVERVPAGRFVEAEEEARVEGDVTILPVYEERLVVEKRLYLVEEVHLRRVTRTHEIQEPVEIHRQVVDVERLPPWPIFQTELTLIKERQNDGQYIQRFANRHRDVRQCLRSRARDLASSGGGSFLQRDPPHPGLQLGLFGNCGRDGHDLP